MAEPFRITAPGIYPDMTSAQYFADPAPAPSLTQSVAKILLEQSPLHAWHAHPRLNPDYRHDDDRKFDVGNIAHALMLGRGKLITVLEFDDWRTKAAKEASEAAAAEGNLAVLGKHYSLAERMVKAAREQLEHRELGHYFSGEGQAECCLAWQEGDIWFRQLVDWVWFHARTATVVDYKTTDMSVAPAGLGRMMAAAGWPIQAAMADRGLDALKPETKGLHDFEFVVQETEPPYCLNVVGISSDVLMLGRKRLEIGANIWRQCVAANRWPGYPAEIIIPEMPGFIEQQWLDREISEAAQSRVPQHNRHADNVLAG